MNVPSRLAWVLGGVALDAAVLGALWLALQAAFPLGATATWWLQVLGLAACAWFVHVLALPAMLRSSGPRQRWVLHSVAFLISVGLFSPVAAILAGLFMPWLMLVVTVAVMPHLVGAVLLWVHELLEPGFWAAVGMVVGGVVGLLMGVARRLDRSKDDPRALPFLVDLLGGLLGGLLVMAALFMAAWAGLLAWEAETAVSPVDLIARAPFRPIMIGVGVVALLPHLLLAAPRKLRGGLPAPRAPIAA